MLKYEFCMRYSLSMGFTCTPLGVCPWGWPCGWPCEGWGGGCEGAISRLCSDKVSEPASSSGSKFALSSKEMSELQKLSPEWPG